MSDAISTDGVTAPARRPPRTFKPRRRALSPQRQAMVERLADRWCLGDHGPVLDLAGVYGRTAPVVLDIGVGHGESTVALAAARPHEDVLAVEVHTPGVATLLDAIDRDGLGNVRVVHGDAVDLLDRLAPGSLHGVRIFFPDPWPKQRQRHRRLVRPDVVDRLVDRLAPGGTVHLATDSADYARQMQAVCTAHGALGGGPIERPSWRPVTRFEQRGIDEGRPAVDLWYRRR